MVRLALAICRQLRGRRSKSQDRRTGGGFNRRCAMSSFDREPMPTPGSDTLEALAAVFRADSNPLSLVREGTVPLVVIPGVWRQSPKNFRKILDLSTRASRSGHGVVVLTNVTREKALARERANTSAALELTPSS